MNIFETTAKKPDDFIVPGRSGHVRIIDVIDGQLITGSASGHVPVRDGRLTCDTENNVLKIAVVNRYKEAPPAVAFVRGFNLKKGAIASSVAHDSHNIIAVGTSDEMLCEAVNCIVEKKGGISLVSDDMKVVLPLTVAGIMSDEDGHDVALKYNRMNILARELGCALNIVFMGTPAFAVPSLQSLLDAGHTVVAAATAPDKPRGRGQHVLPTPMKDLALRRGIPVLVPASVRDPQFASDLTALSPDLFVVVAFRILPPQVFTIPPLGAFNLHASLLPRYRGVAPINWALINGETETGLTTFFLREQVDTGAMLFQERVAITPDDDAGSLHDRLAEAGARLVLRTVAAIERGEATPVPQDDSLATPIFPPSVLTTPFP